MFSKSAKLNILYTSWDENRKAKSMASKAAESLGTFLLGIELIEAFARTLPAIMRPQPIGRASLDLIFEHAEILLGDAKPRNIFDRIAHQHELAGVVSAIGASDIYVDSHSVYQSGDALGTGKDGCIVALE